MPQFDSEYEKKLYDDRLASLKKIEELGTSKFGLNAGEATYPNSFRFSPEGTSVPKIRAAFAEVSGEDLERDQPTFAVAGRLMAIRAQGKAGFAQLQQGGERIQLYVRKDDVGEDAFELYKNLHLGDHIGVRGHLMRTRTGELTLKATPVDGRQPLVFLSKATLTLPDKYHGLEDVELRYRQRYVDLIMNSTKPEPVAATEPGAPSVSPSSGETGGPATEEHRNVREVFIKRAAVLRAIRKFFDEREYIEVETPMLHSVAGGATARPFTTHHNALDMPLYLRIAPELFLKRLVVGGFDRVYEINRNFRNEGVSTRHNPEFTMLEFYQAYANYEDLIALTEELIKFVAMEVNGSYITHFNGNEIDLSKWTKLSMREAIARYLPSEAGVEISKADLNSRGVFAEKLLTASQNLTSHLKSLPQNAEWNSDPQPWTPEADHLDRLRDASLFFALISAKLTNGDTLGKMIAEVFEFLAEPHLIQPHIIYDFPLAVSPLSKINPLDPEWTERFEFYIGGFEVGNAFSELNDAADQERRFEAQVNEKARGDDEAMEMDSDYVRALGYGLPPTAGEGIGIDRLTMLLTGSKSIRDVILFPLMRHQGGQPKDENEPHGESAE
ncbi:lysine--tRNA ligase [Granulicella cerasi]|uniref:lysine--tRNA ligase n=1 Tax=Granulicella cerasi TaxID=741063 RepID=UPI0021E0A55B|nr:lysine--tRNA ligase [Granulicella cerasi]